jgi:hypothetical protein
MSLITRIQQRVNLTDPQQVKKAVGSLWFYFERYPKERKVCLFACEWIFGQAHDQIGSTWKSVLIYTSSVLDKMRKSLK